MTTFKIEGMSCQHCVKAVENALGSVPGVGSVQVKIGEARFEAASEETVRSAVQAVEDAGYSVVSTDAR